MAQVRSESCKEQSPSKVHIESAATRLLYLSVSKLDAMDYESQAQYKSFIQVLPVKAVGGMDACCHI